MSPLAAVATRSAALVLLLSVAAACTSGGSPATSETPLPAVSPSRPTSFTPAPSATPVVTPAATADVTPAPTATTPSTPTPPATSTADPAADPPVARLAGLAGGAVDGDLGSFAWDGFVSDAPWIIGAARGTASPGAGLSISFQPDGQVAAWRARWASVSGGAAGTPTAGGAGTSAVIDPTAPRAAGTWSLQVTVDFGADRSATWYWRVKVTR
jgi:hypothetical protein